MPAQCDYSGQAQDLPLQTCLLMNIQTVLRNLIASLFLLCLLLGVGSAQAHASLVSSEPRGGASLAEAPAEISFDFTETVDPTLATVTLRDGLGEIVVEGDGIIDPADGRRMTFSLPELADGTYSAVWNVRSAVDGHVTSGTVAFSIGAESAAASLLPPPGTPEPATLWPSALDTFFRYANYITVAVALGPLLFGLLVWLPTRRRLLAPSAAADERVTGLLRRVSQIGLAAAAIGTLGFALNQAIQNSPENWLAAVFAGRNGLLLALRLLLAAVLFWLVRRLPVLSRARPLWWAAAGLAGALLLTFSLHSHNAALGGSQWIVATIIDWLHLLAMAAWMGGLLALALLLRPGLLELDIRRALVPHFSRLALFSVLTLSLSGLYSAIIHVRTLEALWATTYGRMVTTKSVLFAILLAFGAVNLLVLSPRLAGAGQQILGWLRRTVRLEMALGLLLLLAVGVLMGVSPAQEALEAGRRQGFVETYRQDNVGLTLRVAPLQVGDNEFAVDVVDQRPGIETVVPQVVLRLSAAGEEMGTTEVATEQSAVGSAVARYTARGAYLSVAGEWDIQVILRAAGFDDVVNVFTVVAGEGGEERLEIGD